MNIKLKKCIIASAILSMTGSVTAGTVTGMFGGIEALYLQPRNGDTDFFTQTPVVTAPYYETAAIGTRYQWDFRLYGGLTFCGNDDLTVSWLRYHANASSLFSQPSGEPGQVRWLGFLFFDSNILGRVNYNLDDVYGVYAHTVNLGIWNVRFGGGVEWAKLISDMKMFDSAIPTSVQRQDEEDEAGNNLSRMYGFGPRVEGDMTYNLPFGLGAFARTNAALLIARRYVDVNNNAVPINVELDRHLTVVPKLGIKLGLSYATYFGNVGGESASFGTNVSLELGWQAETYVHAVERSQGWGSVGGEGPLSNTLVKTKVSNYSFQGLFIGAKVATGCM